MGSPERNTNGKKQPIRNDPFITELLQRIPRHLRSSFTDEQLLSLKIALSGRRWGKHALDIRGTFGFWTWKYYYVVLAGRERRLLSPREERLHRLTNTMFMIGFLTFSTLLGLLILYLIKSALGIDIFPDSHLRIIPGYDGSTWKWFQEKVF